MFAEHLEVRVLIKRFFVCLFLTEAQVLFENIQVLSFGSLQNLHVVYGRVFFMFRSECVCKEMRICRASQLLCMLVLDYTERGSALSSALFIRKG